MAFDPLAGLSPAASSIIGTAATGAIGGVLYGALTAPKGDRQHDAVHYAWIGATIGAFAGVFFAGLGVVEKGVQPVASNP
jgi:hypothetical protein